MTEPAIRLFIPNPVTYITVVDWIEELGNKLNVICGYEEGSCG